MSSNELSVFRIDDGEQHWFAAYDAGHAITQWAGDYCGAEALAFVPGEAAGITIVREPDEETLKVESDDGTPAQTKTMREWAKDGAGMIASTVW